MYARPPKLREGFRVQEDTMNAAPNSPTALTWRALRENLDGSFTVRARGLLSHVFVFQREGVEAGRLRLDGLRGAEFAAGTLAATIERVGNSGYRMFSGGEQILTATLRTSSLETLEIAGSGSAYTARVKFFRNEARIFSLAGVETAQLKGGMMGRRYEIMVDEADTNALPTAILLLYHTAAFRRRIYTTRAAVGAVGVKGVRLYDTKPGREEDR